MWGSPYDNAQLSPEQLLTFGRHRAETVGGLWLIDNVVPLRPGGKQSRVTAVQTLGEVRVTCKRKGFWPLVKEPLLGALPKPP